MTDHSQLVKRLREHTQAFGTHYEQRQVDVCIEAADAIETLQARVEALEAGRDDLRSILIEARSGLIAYTGSRFGACSETLRRIDTLLERN